MQIDVFKVDLYFDCLYKLWKLKKVLMLLVQVFCTIKFY